MSSVVFPVFSGLPRWNSAPFLGHHPRAKRSASTVVIVSLKLCLQRKTQVENEAFTLLRLRKIFKRTHGFLIGGFQQTLILGFVVEIHALRQYQCVTCGSSNVTNCVVWNVTLLVRHYQILVESSRWFLWKLLLDLAETMSKKFFRYLLDCLHQGCQTHFSSGANSGKFNLKRAGPM